MNKMRDINISFNKKLKLILQVRDTFGTSKYESITETPELYN